MAQVGSTCAPFCQDSSVIQQRLRQRPLPLAQTLLPRIFVAILFASFPPTHWKGEPSRNALMH